ncbi:MAG: two-component system, OmpR family, sensor histidine kinase MtrB, partial [Solirubrobacteraceae bacterium]|nr:two-component system, OmpR family, sensor histidine kinase MtrB [Solirubrobacteraceae bacterium]
NALRHGSPPVTVTARTAGETLEVHVLDRGGGFPEDALGLPMDGTPRTNARGFGLGLAIVASIARAHGGQAVTANTADGADAWLSLPAD